MRRASVATTLLIASMVLAGCESVTTRQTEGPVPLLAAQGEIPEQQLLDIGIEVFDPGPLPESADEVLGIPREIRNAESRFMPVHLKHSLQRTGHWGAVRVVPAGTEGTEVRVRGQIQESDGEVLQLRIDADDATGQRWFSKTYRTVAAARDYLGNQPEVKDAFQDLYHTIANDLSAFRLGMNATQIDNIRRISELRFAADFAPDAFGQHLVADAQGNYQVQRLPARDDPMLSRVRAIRDRDHLLVDTVNGHFDAFYNEMWEPYRQWRTFRSEEAAALREVESEALNRKLLGAAAIAGAIALQIFGNDEVSSNTSTLRNVMVVGGALAVKSGFDKGAEAQIHEEALRELGISFEAEVTPLIVEVEGETVELTGSAEAQYQTWRGLLRKIYAAETGLLVPVTTDAAVPSI